uniref:Uncharacterized protein n=1 Tax=Heterorhabditis bacteriophora TaxID=37862 RepID=A0A1I7W9E7_HETBA
MTFPYYLIFVTWVPKTVQHLSAKRFRSAQNYPTSSRRGFGKRALRQSPGS